MMATAERDSYRTIDLEETELRLGLPGGGGGGNDAEIAKNNGKRGFLETETVDLTYQKQKKKETVDLKLNISTAADARDLGVDPGDQMKMKEKIPLPRSSDPAKPPAKALVVGWPPVRSFRKNAMASQKNNTDDAEKAATGGSSGSVTFVKVSMDGAPYLRKVDLKLYKNYQELCDALGKMFSSFIIGNCGSQGMKDYMSESKLIDLLDSSEYVPTYEDKDGDWMLAGDVPWEMFVDSCKRLRIMKGSEAIGPAPRALEKCESRS